MEGKKAKNYYIERMTFLAIDDRSGYYETFPLIYGGLSVDGSDFKWGTRIFNDMVGEPVLELSSYLSDIHTAITKIRERIGEGEIRVYHKRSIGYKELISPDDFDSLINAHRFPCLDIDQYDLSGIGFAFTFKVDGERIFGYELSGEDEYYECTLALDRKYRSIHVMDIEPISARTGSYKSIEKVIDHKRFNTEMTTQEKVFVIEYEEGETGYLYGFYREKGKTVRYLSKNDYRKAAWFKDENKAIETLLFLSKKFDISAGLREIDTYGQQFPETPFFIEESL